jgi:hypothetical protein
MAVPEPYRSSGWPRKPELTPAARPSRWATAESRRDPEWLPVDLACVLQYSAVVGEHHREYVHTGPWIDLRQYGRRREVVRTGIGDAGDELVRRADSACPVGVEPREINANRSRTGSR